MRTNPDDVMRTTLTCPGDLEHARTTGRTLDHEQAARAADSSESKWFGIKGVLGYGGMGVWGQYRCREFLQDRGGLSFARRGESPKKK